MPGRLISSCVLAGLCGCAGRTPDAAKDDQNRTATALRAQNASYVRQIEALQNENFILRDQLDSRKVEAQKAEPPRLPVVTLHPAEEASNPGGHDGPYFPGETDVEYAGDAASTTTERPVLKLTGSDPPRPTEASAPPRRSSARRPPLADRTHASIRDPDPIANDLATDRAAIGGELKVTARRRSLPPAAVAAATRPGSGAQAAPVIELDSAAPAVASAVASSDPDPVSLYRKSHERLKAKQHAEAVAGFRDFLAKHPRHDYADNAQYWLGECFYDLRDHRSALREFRKVVEKYPSGNKVPDAMLKVGFSYLALQETAAGRQVLEQLTRSYPTHEAAARARERLQQVDGSSTGASAPKPTEVR